MIPGSLLALPMRHPLLDILTVRRCSRHCLQKLCKFVVMPNGVSLVSVVSSAKQMHAGTADPIIAALSVVV